MARAPKDRLGKLRKPLLLLCLLVSLWWITPALFKSVAQISFNEFQAPLWQLDAKLEDLQEFWARTNHSKKKLIQAGQQLSRSLSAAQLQHSQYTALTQEIDRLNGLLDLPKRPSFTQAIARVIRREINGWWQELTIGKGRNYGIVPGAAVVFAGGIVGRVKTVAARTATVELVSSPNFRMIAEFVNDDRPVTYQGRILRPFALPEGEVAIVPRDMQIGQNERLRLVSSSLSEIFPPGLTIGIVDHLKPTQDDLFQKGSVRLNQRLLSLKEVVVLLPKGTSKTATVRED